MAMTRKHGPGPKLDIVTLIQLVQDSVRSQLPPAGFDPMAAPQQELDKYAFPKRPDPTLQPRAYAFWEKMFASPFAFDAFDFDKTFPSLNTQPRRGFFAQMPRQQDSPNWSGAYITPRDGTVFSEIWTEYQVPTPNQPADGTAATYSSSTWIGLDGQRSYYMSTLPQFGTSQNIDVSTGVPMRSYFAWWQWWARDVLGAAYPIPLAAPTIHASDLIMLFMQVADNRAGVSFMMKNVTTGRVVQFFQSPPTVPGLPFKVSGATAEWVMERPADPPHPTPLQQLPDYGTVDFHDCGATAVNMDTGVSVERSLSAARLIDMYVVREGPERIVKNSIAEQLSNSEFLTEYRY
jgi:hypothetical protein